MIVCFRLLMAAENFAFMQQYELFPRFFFACRRLHAFDTGVSMYLIHAVWSSRTQFATQHGDGHRRRFSAGFRFHVINCTINCGYGASIIFINIYVCWTAVTNREISASSDSTDNLLCGYWSPKTRIRLLTVNLELCLRLSYFQTRIQLLAAITCYMTLNSVFGRRFECVPFY